MLKNISKIKYLCDVKEFWSNFQIIYVLMGFIIIIITILFDKQLLLLLLLVVVVVVRKF